ncbi:MAG: hypothetical protein V3T76_07105, partial [candidate division NC10 bacterium]
RVFLRKQFNHMDGRDVMLATFYDSWSELDEPGGGGNFVEAFQALHGEAAWTLYQTNRPAAVNGTVDEWRQRIPALSGGSN